MFWLLRCVRFVLFCFFSVFFFIVIVIVGVLAWSRSVVFTCADPTGLSYVESVTKRIVKLADFVFFFFSFLTGVDTRSDLDPRLLCRLHRRL